MTNSESTARLGPPDTGEVRDQNKSPAADPVEPNVPRLTLVDLNEVIRRLSPRLCRILRKHRSLTLSLSPDIGMIVADTKQLEQSLVDIALKARQAMPGGGTLWITTRNAAARPDPTPVVDHAAPLKRFVMIDARNTGADRVTTIYLPRLF
jgi:signal transduction histidine kinase